MGKRSNFERVPRDFYETPWEAVIPLLPHIKDIKTFCEPCYGKGALASWLTAKYHGMSIIEAYEIQSVSELGVEYPKDYDYSQGIQYETDALSITEIRADAIITNPPWDRKVLHPMINHFRLLKPTWLLFDANWAYTKQSKGYIKYCSDIVAVGRVKWIPDSKMTGKDDCAWYQFQNHECETRFHGRT